MKKKNLKKVKQLAGTVLFVTLLSLIFVLVNAQEIQYADNPKRMDWQNDGPYVFFQEDGLIEVNYLKENQENEYSVEKVSYPKDSIIQLSSYFNLDGSEFHFSLDASKLESPKSEYVDGNKIFAVSDIESGYSTFRDLLINNQIIDEEINWTFGNGHLVLVGDVVDKGFSTTQLLWFIYKLEKEAQLKGGKVHFLIGNHEIKNMQENFDGASPKFHQVSSILGRTQGDLFDKKSFIGKWISSKNAIELINGHLFVHGGIHPDVAKLKIDIDEINEYIRDRYYKSKKPKKKKSNKQILVSDKNGPIWYRGYFRDEKLKQKQVEKGLDKFGAVDVIVGHTVQSKVNRSFEGKVIGIDVLHPKDYYKFWPRRKSEALLIQGIEYYRVLHSGKRIQI